MYKRIKRFFTRKYTAENPPSLDTTSVGGLLPEGSGAKPSSPAPTESTKVSVEFLGDVVYLMLFVLFVGMLLMGGATIALWYQAITEKTASYDELNQQITQQNDKIDTITQGRRQTDMKKIPLILMLLGASVLAYQVLVSMDCLNAPWFTSSVCFNQFHPLIAVSVGGLGFSVLGAILLAI